LRKYLQNPRFGGDLEVFLTTRLDLKYKMGYSLIGMGNNL
jgi:hypothetical protein